VIQPTPPSDLSEGEGQVDGPEMWDGSTPFFLAIPTVPGPAPAVPSEEAAAATTSSRFLSRFGSSRVEKF
jgi:hypothetical protein